MAEETNAMANGFMMGAECKSGSGGGYGGMGFGMDSIIALAALGLIFGRGGGLFGGGENNGSVATQADLAAGFNNSTVLSTLGDIQLAQANAINYNNQGFAGLNTALLQGFNGVDNAICTLGYQNQQGFNTLGSQLAKCCCDIELGTERSTNAIQGQIKDCCCDLEKMNMQNRFDAQTYNCTTLSAIDKLGDRIIGYMNDRDAQNMRDELQALRLSASQAKQNQYLINELRPIAKPSYLSCSPYAASWGVGFGGYGGYGRDGGCGCGGCSQQLLNSGRASALP